MVELRYKITEVTPRWLKIIRDTGLYRPEHVVDTRLTDMKPPGLILNVPPASSSRILSAA